MNEPAGERKEKINIRNSRVTANMLAEVLFVFLPLVVMAIVFSVEGDILGSKGKTRARDFFR